MACFYNLSGPSLKIESCEQFRNPFFLGYNMRMMVFSVSFVFFFTFIAGY